MSAIKVLPWDGTANRRKKPDEWQSQHSTLVGSHKPAFAVACISLQIFHMKFQVKEKQLLKIFQQQQK